ncbi:FHA domain-containing protein [bacterium]|nr:FHA domain-containing protein [bacterium]MCI0601481.1 FHA domain-containing protein [bacterium]
MKKCLVFLIVFVSLPLFAAEKQATAILLDNSKSISPQDFQKAKTLIQEIVAQLDGTKLIYQFGNDMKKIEPSDLETVQANESYTMIYDAAYDSAKELSEIQAEHKAILIISDGIDTKSATVLEDVVGYANSKGIAIYAVGVGKANRKILERMARLTNGMYFSITSTDLVNQLQTSIASQKAVPQNEAAKPTSVQQPGPSIPVVTPPAVSVPVESPQESRVPYKWILLLLLGAVAVIVVGIIVARAYRTEPRICPTCGRRLDPYQTICPVCSTGETRQTKQIQVPVTAPADGTQEILLDDDRIGAIPLELLEKKPVSEEMLSKTFVLMETPMLVVRKGKNLGQTFSLNRAFPVSIGRSRVNEIRLDDITISGQHCRVIPENGRHVLYDLNSTNGTFLNEKKVTRAILKEGDIIRVGETHFLYKIEQHRS